jgi:hypothetical protein
MQDDNRTTILSLAERVDVPPSDAREAIRRGRRRRVRGRIGSGIVLTALAASGFVGVGTVLDGSDSAGTSGGAVPAAGSGVENSRVATFAVRALAQAGLANPVGDFNDYRSAERADDGWVVSLETVRCDPSTCTDHPDGDGSLEVRLDRGALQIVSVTGPYTDEQREELLAYREEPNEERFGLLFVSPKLVEGADEGISVITSPLWTGPLGAAESSAVECRVELYDESGALVYSGDWRPQPAPNEEEMRSGSITIFGVPREQVEGDPASAEVPCQTD